MCTIGDIKYSLQENDHYGWLLCDGRILLKSNYPDLSTSIGNTFGSMSNSTFQLPDVRGNILAGINNNPYIVNSTSISEHQIGSQEGSYTVSVTNNQLPQHVHSGTVNTSGIHGHGMVTGIDGVHQHTGITNGGTADGLHTHLTAPNSSTFVINNSRDTDISAVGSGESLPDPFNLNGFTTNVGGSHIHHLNKDGYHNHGITNDGGHQHTFTTTNTGLGNPHNNVQPTIFIGNVFIYSGYLPQVV